MQLMTISTIHSLPFLLLLLTLSHALPPSPQSLRIQTLEQQITQQTKMDFSSYKLYPFAISTRQQFSLSFTERENVKAEIKVNWIDIGRSQLVYPRYDVGEFVRVRVVDGDGDGRVVQERKFYFQTGLNFVAQPNHRYRLIFTDSGNQNKMIQLAISRIEPSRLSLLASNSSSPKTSQISKAIESSLSSLTSQTERTQLSIQNAYRYILDSLGQYLVFSVWEVCLVGGMMVWQVFVVGALVRNSGVV